LYFTLFVEVKQKVAEVAIFSRNGGNVSHEKIGYWQPHCGFFFKVMALNQPLQRFYRESSLE
jgi:hypothetical protein